MRKHTKVTLTREEGFRLEKFVSDNLENFNNRSSKDIAKECNESLAFVKDDGSPKHLNNQHIDRHWDMRNRLGFPVWQKDNYKDRSTSKLETVIDRLSHRLAEMEKRHEHLIGSLIERVFSLEEKLKKTNRECTEEVAFSTNKSRGDALDKLFDNVRDN